MRCEYPRVCEISKLQALSIHATEGSECIPPSRQAAFVGPPQAVVHRGIRWNRRGFPLVVFQTTGSKILEVDLGVLIDDRIVLKRESGTRITHF